MYKLLSLLVFLGVVITISQFNSKKVTRVYTPPTPTPKPSIQTPTPSKKESISPTITQTQKNIVPPIIRSHEIENDSFEFDN